MTDPATFTQEHRNWQWELVLRFEDGSLPASDWNEHTLRTVSAWYAKNLPREKALERYHDHYQKNRRRLTHRREGAHVETASIEALDGIWEGLLTQALDAKA
jgi:hypothetical protein